MAMANCWRRWVPESSSPRSLTNVPLGSSKTSVDAAEWGADRADRESRTEGETFFTNWADGVESVVPTLGVCSWLARRMGFILRRWKFIATAVAIACPGKKFALLFSSADQWITTEIDVPQHAGHRRSMCVHPCSCDALQYQPA